MTHEEREREYAAVLARYRDFQAMGLSLNISRGKPGADQVSLSRDLLTGLSPEDCAAEDGTDVRNYGGLDGLPEMKRLFAEILDVAPGEVIVGGNSSLNLMFDCVATLLTLDENWRGPVKFLCPVPGYDRHFAVCDYFNIETIPVGMTPEGPDMDAAEALAAGDPAVAGMWCVPVFTNPQGYTYSDETVRRLAAMPALNPGFRLMWDNAYAVHHFRGPRPNPPNILRVCEALGKPDRPFIFTSFSKISIPGASVSCLAASENNRAVILKRLFAQTVGPDKVNQLRHARFFKDLPGVLAHMEKHAALIRPKFERAEAVFERELGGTGTGAWHSPDGGYFIPFDTLPGCAKQTAALCRAAGLTLTEAGATFPGGNDPQDRNIRVCPTYVSEGELEQALTLFCAAVKLAALEKLSPSLRSAAGDRLYG